MSFLYVQRTGQMYRDRCLFAKGYAGIYTGKNNPDMQQTHNTGPLPCGIYRISDAYEHTALGPLTMDLKPDVANEMFGRDYFRIHGDSRHGVSRMHRSPAHRTSRNVQSSNSRRTRT